MAYLQELKINVPRRNEINPPTKMGPSQFPSSIDQLKLIEYSSVPNGGQLEKDLKDYYTLMASVASNNASPQDLVTLKSLMVRIRNYVLTEDDFNLMSDSIRTTQSYLKASIEAADGNFELISVVAEQLVDQINEWSLWLQEELAILATGKNLGAPVIYGEFSPGPSALGYLWVNDNIPDDYIAPRLIWDDQDINKFNNSL